MIAKKFLFHQPEDTRFFSSDQPVDLWIQLRVRKQIHKPTTPPEGKKDKPAIRTKKAFRYKNNERPPSYLQAD